MLHVIYRRLSAEEFNVENINTLLYGVKLGQALSLEQPIGFTEGVNA